MNGKEILCYESEIGKIFSSGISRESELVKKVFNFKFSIENLFMQKPTEKPLKTGIVLLFCRNIRTMC